MSESEPPNQPAVKTSLQRGAAVIRAKAALLPEGPGVYRMIDAKGDVLYVGKARSLKKRVVTYSLTARLPNRLKRMVSLTVDMEFVHTHTEIEALLLESNLIKKFRPRFNVLMRDDKSFPYILITADHDYPQITKHRGAQTRKGAYYGPYISSNSVYKTVTTLQRVCMLRNCSDTVFATRQRPCLQYHIKRCTAPCVDYVTKDEYAQQVKDARDFLSGRSGDLQNRLGEAMQKASDDLNYEEAARIRDRLKVLSEIGTRQDINMGELKDADIFAITIRESVACIQVFFYRNGQNMGNKAYFPIYDSESSEAAVLADFMMQFYDSKTPSADIILSHKIMEQGLIAEALSVKAGRRVSVSVPERGARKRIVDFALRNTADALTRYIQERKGDAVLLEAVANLFEMEAPPQRIEVYDNSHISGTNMVGGMIVAGAEGFNRAAYRKFNIRDYAGDDFGAMREVMSRRFSRLLKEDDEEEAVWPDLLLIDGGAGQLSSVLQVLSELGVKDDVKVVGISKGPERNAGREKFHIEGREVFQLPENDPVLHYLQRLRDEAHRFAIGAHRVRRAGTVKASVLDEIPNIGPKRKKALLLHFGSARAMAQAGLHDLQKVPGISLEVARKIYEFFHESRG